MRKHAQGAARQIMLLRALLVGSSWARTNLQPAYSRLRVLPAFRVPRSGIFSGLAAGPPIAEKFGPVHLEFGLL